MPSLRKDAKRGTTQKSDKERKTKKERKRKRTDVKSCRKRRKAVSDRERGHEGRNLLRGPASITSIEQRRPILCFPFFFLCLFCFFC